MKKPISLLFAFLFLLSFAAPILAQPNSTSLPSQQQLDRKKKKKKKKHPGQASFQAGNSNASRTTAQAA